MRPLYHPTARRPFGRFGRVGRPSPMRGHARSFATTRGWERPRSSYQASYWSPGWAERVGRSAAFDLRTELLGSATVRPRHPGPYDDRVQVDASTCDCLAKFGGGWGDVAVVLEDYWFSRSHSIGDGVLVPLHALESVRSCTGQRRPADRRSVGRRLVANRHLEFNISGSGDRFGCDRSVRLPEHQGCCAGARARCGCQ